MKLILSLLLLMCICPRAIATEPGAEIGRLVGFRAHINIVETDGKVTVLIAK